jgi:hypothetical protein
LDNLGRCLLGADRANARKCPISNGGWPLADCPSETPYSKVCGALANKFALVRGDLRFRLRTLTWIKFTIVMHELLSAAGSN